jgi:group I intron endonuclease
MSLVAVYFIRNIVDGKMYIGSSVSTHQRLNKHRNLLTKGKHPNEYLQRAFAKHGADKFEFGIIEQCEASERLIREQEWIDRLSTEQEAKGYNLIPTRKSQLYGKALSVHQRKGWAALTKEQRRQIASHLTDPAMKVIAQAAANAARATPEHAEKRRIIAARTITTDATRRKNSERLKRLWQDPAFRAQRLAGLDRGRAKTNAARRKQPHDEIVSSAANNEAAGLG